jgi:hypothetical protein
MWGLGGRVPRAVVGSEETELRSIHPLLAAIHSHPVIVYIRELGREYPAHNACVSSSPYPAGLSGWKSSLPTLNSGRKDYITQFNTGWRLWELKSYVHMFCVVSDSRD